MKGASLIGGIVLTALACACQKAGPQGQGADPWFAAEPVLGQRPLTYKAIQAVNDRCSEAFLADLWMSTLAAEPEPVDLRGAVFNSVSRYVWDEGRKYQILTGWMSLDKGNNGISVSGFYRYDENLKPLVALGFDKWSAHAETSVPAWGFPLVLFRSDPKAAASQSGAERASPGDVPVEVRLLNGAAADVIVPMKVWKQPYPRAVKLRLSDYVACLRAGLIQ